MKKLSFLLIALWSATVSVSAQIDNILQQLRDSDSPTVLVAAHRADWRNAPENSLNAIRRAIHMGVDIIEVDVRRTKDGKFVIIHDRTLDRTTTGQGLVADHTLAELSELRLLAATGHPTDEKIPTLEEVLEAVRGRAVINLDKAFEYPDEIFAVVEACHAVDYSLLPVTQRRDEFRRLHPGFLEKALFMIVVPLSKPDAWVLINEYLVHEKPAVIQVTFSRDDDPLLAKLDEFGKHGVRLWVNSIWPEQNGGHDDERAVQDPDGAYGWLLKQGVNVIQTDRPQLLLEYLRTRGHHQ